jgi:AAA15 family ATPase/GTPase
MFNSIEIKNYRNIQDIEFPSLGSINLITGKNGCGKSAFLEAISILLKNGKLFWLKTILDERGEGFSFNNNKLNQNLEMLSNLFAHRKTVFADFNKVTISAKKTDGQTRNVQFRFVFYKESENLNPLAIRTKEVLSDEEIKSNVKGYPAFQIKTENLDELYSLAEKDLFNIGLNDYLFTLVKEDKIEISVPFEFIRTYNTEKNNNAILWDKIALTIKENYVTAALKIIEPKIERLAFVEEYKALRRPIAMLNTGEKVPLKSMGDGLNRILSIILSLINSENGYLLIDEFENGLHYSIQEQLWKIIFKLAGELNCQVFATTHSYDCIVAFANVLNNQQNNINGKLFRLERDGDTIKQVEYNSKELQIAAENNIETR